MTPCIPPPPLYPGVNRPGPQTFAEACEAARPVTAHTFWDAVREVAGAAEDAPDWQKAGINLNPQNFETFRPEPGGEHEGIWAAEAALYVNALLAVRR